MANTGRARLLYAFGVLALGGCMLAPVRRTRYFPVVAPGSGSQARMPDGWTVSVKGDIATGRMRLLRAGERVAALIEVLNEASEEPLHVQGLHAYGGDRAPLNRDAARLSEGLASVIVGDFYKERAEAPHQAEFLQASGFRDGPVPKGLSQRGTAVFGLSGQKPPFTVELELARGERRESLAFTFKEFGPEDFWDDPELVMQDPGRFFRSLKFEERQEAFEAARRMRRDRESFARMKAADPKRYELLEWVRIHEYDIEF